MTEEIVAPVQTEETVRAEMPEIIDSTPTESAGKKEKFYGIELLRILATFYIILLHIIGQGGVSAAVGTGRAATIGCSLLLALAYPAVNCYALISGFVGCKSRFKLSRLVSLWVSVVTVNLAVWGAFKLFAPALAANFSLSACFKPLLNNEYWYVTAYFGLSVLTPALNAAVLNLQKKDYTRMLFGLFALFVVLPVVADKDLFWSHTGYSMLWLMLLYLAGAYFRLHVQPAKPGRLAGMLSLGVYVAISVFLALQKQFIEKQLLAENSPNPFYFKNFSYTSVWIVLSSLALFFFFMRINVRKKALCGIISFFSKTSFGVYIIHTQPLVWNALLAGSFAFFAAYSAPVIVLLCIAAALGIYAVCMLAETVRAFLVRITRIEWLIKRIPF